MKNTILILFVFFAFKSFSEEKFQGNFTGDLNTQVSQLSQTHNAKTWQYKAANLYLISGNLNSTMKIWKSSFQANWFFRYSQTKLYQDGHSSNLSHSIYPQKVFARDILKLYTKETKKNEKFESILNQAIYTWEDEELSFIAGRMWIDFGEGIAFNPINPFNTVSSFSPIEASNQASDGMQFVFNLDEKLNLHLYILGDKSFTDYNKEITKTLLIRGDWQYSDRSHIAYIIGEDQNRHKMGVEFSYNKDSGIVVIQVVNNTKRLKQNIVSEPVTQALLGYEHDFTKNWTTRLEVGHNPKDSLTQESVGAQPIIPSNKYVALLNTYAPTDKLTLRANIINDIKTTFSYAHLNIGYQGSSQFQSYFFINRILNLNSSKSAQEKLSAQSSIAQEVGLGIKASF